MSEVADHGMSDAFADLSRSHGAAEEDPYPLYAALRRATPVMEGDILARFGAPSQAGNSDKRRIFTLFRHDDILSVYRRPDVFTSGILGEGLGLFLDGLMISAMDGAEHKMTRQLLQPAFAPSVLERWQSELVEPLARGHYLEPLLPRGGAELVTAFALPYPVHVIYSIIGLPDDPEGFEQFATWGLRILVGPQRDPEAAKRAFAAAVQASQDLYAHLKPIVARRRAEGANGDDLISHLIRAEYDGRRLDDHEVTAFVRMLLPAAAETTTRTFSNLLVLLFRHPETLEAVKADRSLIRAAIDEAVRLEPVSAFAAREVQQDVTLQGVAIPKGAAVSMVTGAANRDEAVFDDPDAFNIRRKPKPAFGFGFGVHMCIGMHIAKMEIEVAVNALFDLMPRLRLDPDQPPPKIAGVRFRGPAALHVRWD